MQTLVVALALVACTAAAGAQRQGAGAAALAIRVVDPAGAAVPGVEVALTGPAKRAARTEAGRIAFEGLRPGTYLLRFERDGFVTLEREVTARAGAATDVTVTLKPLPAPPPPAAPSAVEGKPMFADVPGVIEKDFVGRAPARTSPLACGAHATATLIQLNEPLATHAHEDADELFYVVAGEGNASVGTGRQRLEAGIFLFVPQGMPHGLTPSGRHPLVVLSARAGEPCK